jgi:MFS superfamily sulfate permease-like transporter
MNNILDSLNDKISPIRKNLIHLRWVEYSIYFLNGLAAFFFFMNCIFDPESLTIYFFAGSGFLLFLAQFQLLYIYFWKKNFKKHQHNIHTFQSYHLTLRWGRIALLVLSLGLMVAAISMFISYPQFFSTERIDYYIITSTVIELDFFILSLLYLYYNTQSKQLSNWKPLSKQ